MPCLPLQRFWIDKRGRPTLYAHLGGDTSGWGIGQFVNGKWQIYSGDGVPAIDPRPDWPRLGRDRIDVPVGGGRFQDVTARVSDTIFSFQLQSADPSRTAFVFNEAGEGKSRVVIVHQGRADFFETGHIEAGYQGLSLLATGDRIVSFGNFGLDVFRLHPWRRKRTDLNSKVVKNGGLSAATEVTNRL